MRSRWIFSKLMMLLKVTTLSQKLLLTYLNSMNSERKCFSATLWPIRKYSRKSKLQHSNDSLKHSQSKKMSIPCRQTGWCTHTRQRHSNNFYCFNLCRWDDLASLWIINIPAPTRYAIFKIPLRHGSPSNWLQIIYLPQIAGGIWSLCWRHPCL